jgi:drug/metabolite transporter (DMT)-like permease
MAFDQSIPVILFPGFALGLLCTTLARHAWGGRGNRTRIPMTALAFQIVLSCFVFITPIGWQYLDERIMNLDPRTLAAHAIPGVIVGMLGVMTGWLAWWGAVEPLPPVAVQQVETAKPVEMVPCGICGQGVEAGVRKECRYGCGKVFHQGCLKARESVFRGDNRKCAVCERMVG